MKLTNTWMEKDPQKSGERAQRKPLDNVSNEVLERYQQMLGDDADPREWAFAWRTELNRGGFPAYELLAEEVLAKGKCVGYAACVSICPVDVFDYADELPVATRADACVNCVLCAEVLSPCVTYNDTYPDWMNRIQDIDNETGYRNDNRGMAFSRVLELTDEGRIPMGLIYQGTHPPLQNMLIRKTAPARALEPEHATDAKHYMDRVLSSYAV
jgi:ferredoxin